MDIRERILANAQRDLAFAEVLQRAATDPGCRILLVTVNQYHRTGTTQQLKQAASRSLGKDSISWTSTGVKVHFPLARDSEIFVSDKDKYSLPYDEWDMTVEWPLARAIDLMEANGETVADALANRRTIGILQKVDAPLVMMAKALAEIAWTEKVDAATRVLDQVVPDWVERFHPESSKDQEY